MKKKNYKKKKISKISITFATTIRPELISSSATAMKQTGTEKFGSSGYPRFNVVLLIYFVLLKIINLFII